MKRPPKEGRDDRKPDVSERQAGGASTSAKQRDVWSLLLSVVGTICGIGGGFAAVVTIIDFIEQGKISATLRGVAICAIAIALIAAYFQMRTMDRLMRLLAILTVAAASTGGFAAALDYSPTSASGFGFATPGASDDITGSLQLLARIHL